MVKIRLQRGGRTHRPVYTIVAANSRAARNGKFLEKLGQYDPNAAEVLNSVNVDGIKAWVAKGAQLSDTVNSLFKKNNIKL
jgi:small subunit ribosomal protein S16